MKLIVKCLRQYADFKNRSGNLEFFSFGGFVFVVLGLALVLDRGMGWGREGPFEWMLWYPTFELTRLALVVPFFAVTVRRLRDLRCSVWTALLWFVPILGWGYLLVLLAQPGGEDAEELAC